MCTISPGRDDLSCSVREFVSRFAKFSMALGGGFNILVFILVSWISGTAFAQSSSCSLVPQKVTASKWYNTTITSPSYPSNYANNLDCTWLIEVGSSLLSGGYVVKVTFNDFHLDAGSFSGCYAWHDKLRFYDGISTLYNLLGSYCGTVHPEVIYSTGRHLYVKFYSNIITTGRGFSINVLTVAKEEAAGICRKTDGDYDVHQLSGSSGRIFSPDYPVPYPSNSRCTWVITVPAGKIVKLTFEDFDLGFSFTACKNRTDEIDFVVIRDGKLSDSRELARYCGYKMGSIPDVYSTGNYMRVKFSSTSHLGTAKGFKARYVASELPSKAYSKKLCYQGNIYNNKLTLEGSSGTLRSPKDGSSYPPDSSCDWLITVPDGKIVRLSFDEFELEPSYYSTCTADYVEIRDGKENYSESKGRFCGFNKPEDIHSSGRYMRVSFRSDSESSYYDGFRATFTAEEKEIISKASIIALAVGGTIFVVLTCLVVCVFKCNKNRRNHAGAARIPMSTTTTTSVSHPAQPGVIQHPPPPQEPQPSFQPAAPYPPPTVGYAPDPSNAFPPPPAYPYPSQPPPPYPGEETVPQYPPPGQSYPWLQSAPVEASAPPKSP